MSVCLCVTVRHNVHHSLGPSFKGDEPSGLSTVGEPPQTHQDHVPLWRIASPIINILSSHPRIPPPPRFDFASNKNKVVQPSKELKLGVPVMPLYL